MLKNLYFGSPVLSTLPPPSFSPDKAARRSRITTMSFNQNPLTAITNFIWGPSLPPNLLISTARLTWSTLWHVMMSQLAPSDSSGSYRRPSSQFRISPDDPSLPRRSLHLYVGLPCPWAHRTLIVRALKGLERFIPVSVASPGDDGYWKFLSSPSADAGIAPTADEANGKKTLKEVYNSRSGGYSGRSTVPMLWDCDENEVICNESYDIIEMFNSGLNEVASNPELDLSPPHLKKRIEEWNGIIYKSVNNGVYRCGFAQSQEAYDAAVNELFDVLDTVDDHLGKSRYLCGDELTLADVCLFTTLIRFDVVYNVLFKCTKKKVVEYENLHGYMREIYQIPTVAATCNFEATIEGYYKMLFPLNPGSICPIMPLASQPDTLLKPHLRDKTLSQIPI
ncbi:hypothetical protein M569_12468 [Genlisea aurea]|uniref:GST C-terminal domain-containing protein n=1 Tax=Genlisea aurea TaxID=192259 RepID=S8DR75_9LAMI|nr:hypothetical protein M569_12468 [Genlisea aurea]